MRVLMCYRPIQLRFILQTGLQMINIRLLIIVESKWNNELMQLTQITLNGQKFNSNDEHVDLVLYIIVMQLVLEDLMTFINDATAL